MFMELRGKVCRKRYEAQSYYYYKGKCNDYKYGDPYEGFWVLGEPAQSCIDACINYKIDDTTTSCSFT